MPMRHVVCPDSCPQPGLPVLWPAQWCPARSSPPPLQCSAYPWGRPVPVRRKQWACVQGDAQFHTQLRPGHSWVMGWGGCLGGSAPANFKQAVAHQERLPGGARWQEGVPAPSTALAWARPAHAPSLGHRGSPTPGDCRLVGACLVQPWAAGPSLGGEP